MGIENRKKFFIIVLVFLAGLLLRLFLAVYGNHIDLIINSGWGSWLYQNGARNFYTNSVWIYGWPTQPPLITSIYGFSYEIYKQILWLLTYIGQFSLKHNFLPGILGGWSGIVNWFGWKNFGETPFPNGYLYSMKIIPIISDISIAFIYYLFGKKRIGLKKALVWTFIFLTIPFTWYVSSLWGQYDQLAALLVLGSLLLIFFKGNNLVISVISFVLLFSALEVKLNLFVVLPLFVAVIATGKKFLLQAVLGVAVFAIMFFTTTFPFSGPNVVSYFIQKNIPIIFNPDRLGLANHAFNFWTLLSPAGGWADSFRLLGIKAVYWGVFGLVVLSVISIKLYLKNKSVKSLMSALFILSGGSYIFGTGMVDRYYFLSITVLGILTFYHFKLRWLWLASAIIFSFNLFYSWGYPFLVGNAPWGNQVIIRIMSLLQTILFLTVLYILLRENRANKPRLGHN